MVLDTIWVAGEVLGTAGLLCGAYLVLMEAGPMLRLFGKKPAVPLPLSVRDLRLIADPARSSSSGHPQSGDAEMDREHEGLADDMNCLRSSILAGHPADQVDAFIDVLIRDVVQHFEDEEAILAAAGYPGTAKHTGLHRELVDGLATLTGQFHAGVLGIGELFRYLASDVLARHMLSADREFVPYLENRR
jgi:hemerythrin-like metal-binding protein